MQQESLTLSVERLRRSAGQSTSAHAMLEELLTLLIVDSPRSQIESVALDQALSRIVAGGVKAQCDAPLFSESLRDGYAVASSSPDKIGDDSSAYTIIGESGAGDPLECQLQPGEAWRVMTGGRIPDNCDRVVPQEDCTVNGKILMVPASCLDLPRFIKNKASIFHHGQTLFADGHSVCTGDLISLADSGNARINVYRQPRVCFCCTGKELARSAENIGTAQKISSNQYLLQGLLEQCGCLVTDYGIVGDTEAEVQAFFHNGLNGEYDVLLTTGGTGGGAFDLVERGFLQEGGKIICNSIDLRPGKSTLFGRKKGTLYIGLPGPPHAVHTVFLELVAPLIHKIQGYVGAGHRCIEAIAADDLRAKTGGNILIKEGILFYEGGKCFVRLAGKGESGNSNLLFAPGRDHIKKGELVEVHLRRPQS